jgi:hypothetical protein
MTREAFEDLALRVLEAPGDEPAAAALRQALAEEPQHRAVWQSLCEFYASSGEILAAEHPGTPAAKSISFLHRWQTWAALAAAVLVGLFLWPDSSPDLLAEWREHGPADLQAALTQPLPQLLATAQPAVFRAAATIQLQSPLIAAGAGPVEIAWQGGPAHIRLERDGSVIWEYTGASPVTSPALPANEVYQLEINRLDRPAAAAIRETFVTVTPVENTPGLDGVLQAATAKPARLGEAVLAFHRLPAEVRRSDAGRRIAIWLGQRARQPDLLSSARDAQ